MRTLNFIYIAVFFFSALGLSKAKAEEFWCQGTDWYRYDPDGLEHRFSDTWLNFDSTGNGRMKITLTRGYDKYPSGVRIYEKRTIDNLICSQKEVFELHCDQTTDSTVVVRTRMSEQSDLVLSVEGKNWSVPAGGYMAPYTETYNKGCHPK